MPFDGITLAAVVKELQAELPGARINKIHQPEKNEITFNLYHPGKGNFSMVWSADSQAHRMHLTTVKRTNPSRAPAFCMVLRKHLEGGRIKSIEQIGLERIVRLTVTVMNDFGDPEDKVLLGEFMGKHSNFILLKAEDELIVDALRRYGQPVSRYREILPGKYYSLPPQQNKNDFLIGDYNDFCTAVWSGHTEIMGKSLFDLYIGFSPVAAEAFCRLAGLKPSLSVAECGDYELSKLYQTVRQWLQMLKEGKTEAWYRPMQGGKKSDFAAYQLVDGVAFAASETVPVNRVCDYHFNNLFITRRREEERQNLARKVREELDKNYKKRFFRLGDLKKAQENEKYKQWGELLTAYAYLYKKGDKEAVINDFITGKPVNIRLDERYTPIQNAQRFFKTYNKSRSAQKHLRDLLAELEGVLEYLENALTNVEQAENLKELQVIRQELLNEGIIQDKKTGKQMKGQGRTEKLPPRKFISADGLEIWVGRNNQQNDWLTLKAASAYDLWLHAQKIPGSHVIIRLPETMEIDEIPDTTLLAAAEIAAFYSQARSGSKVPIDYTFRSQVKKPPGTKPGLVTYDNYWTVLVEPQIKADRIPENEE